MELNCFSWKFTILFIYISECDDYKYGENCSFSCGNCEDNEKCSHIDGTCTNGCDKGYQGTKCDTGIEINSIFADQISVYDIFIVYSSIKHKDNIFFIINWTTLSF